VENSTSEAKRLKRARFMPEIEALDLRWCMYSLPLQASRCCREWDGCKWTSVVAVQKSNALSRLASTAKTGRELRCSVLPRGKLPLPRTQIFWPLSDEARRKTHCPIRVFPIQTRGTFRPFQLLPHGEEITRSSTVCSSQVPTTQDGSTVRRDLLLRPAIASKQNIMTSGVYARWESTGWADA
jgi:hypothetical protein